MSKAYKDLLLKEAKELLKKLPPNVRIRVYYDDMGKGNYTLNQLGTTVDKLAAKVDQIGDMVLSLSTRLDNLTSEVNERFNQIDTRLDYIVKANNLKDLPESKK